MQSGSGSASRSDTGDLVLVDYALVTALAAEDAHVAAVFFGDDFT
jgi:hypothetical protein